jgi:hypothetical protein
MFPMTKRTHEDSTAADKTSIGFDYQYYYFLNKLLELGKGEKIGYEVKDDVHIELANGQLILIQTKHTLKVNKKNETIKLNERDGDLWKTLYNWIKVINDNVLGRSEHVKQLEFMKNTEFVLASNKRENEGNLVFVNIKMFREGTININQFRAYFRNFIAESKESKEGDNRLKKYMEELNNQNDDWLATFLFKLTFNLDEDELIQKIRNKIAEKIYEDNIDRIDDVLHCVNSNTSIWKYENIKKGLKVELGFDEVKKLFYKCFHNARSNKLPNRKFKITLPDKLEEQVFIKQLIDIGDVEQNDLPVMAEYTTAKMKLSRNLESWIQNSDITEDEKKLFEDDSITKWRTNFRKMHRGPKTQTPQLKNENALECLDNMRAIDLEIQNQKIGTLLSHGLFYSLSDKPVIGWLPDWEDKYKK